MNKVTEIITAMRERYVAEGRAASFHAINQGICSDFADDVVAEARDALPIDVFSNDHFTGGGEFDDEKWDRPLLENLWAISPPEGLTWDDLDAIDFGLHDWIHCDGLHFDAECPEGVKNFFDLPIFRRCLERRASVSV